MSTAAAPPRAPSEIEQQQIEEMFDKADDLMINQNNHAEAVSRVPCPLTPRHVLENGLLGHPQTGPRQHRRA